VIRKLVAAWINQCTNQNESSVQQRLGVAGTYQLSEAVPLAVSVALGRDDYRGLSPATRLAALILIAQLGTREQVDRLEPLLEDATVCFPAGMVRQRVGAPTGEEVQIRDVALVMLLQMTDQRPDEYGYPHAQRNGRELNPVLMYPSSAAERPRALAKWRRWKTSQPAPASAGNDSPAAGKTNAASDGKRSK
jgi:hypothetical protein